MNPIDPDNLPAAPGTYVLLLAVSQPLTWHTGRLGKHTLSPGWAAYVGSAHGPGGLRARVGRHLRHSKPIHWHIDTLTAHLPVRMVWYCASTTRHECEWAAILDNLTGVTRPAAGFGSSDCACPTHLFALPDSWLHRAWEALGYPDCLPPAPWSE